MPLLGTRGAGSAFGFGAFASTVLPLVAGAVGLFNVGGPTSTKTMNKYTYANDTVTGYTGLTNGSSSGAGCSNSVTGFIACGNTAALSNVLNYNTNTCIAGPALSAAVALGAGTGNDTLGIIALGNRLAALNIFNYSSKVITGSTVGTTSTQRGSAATSSATIGYIATGLVGSAGTRVTNKYTYAGDTIVAGANLTANMFAATAVGNATLGYFGIGGGAPGSPTWNKYTYSGDTCAATTSLLDNSYGGSAAGTSTFGIVALGNTTAVTNKYTYASDTVVTATALLGAMNVNNGFSNGIAGVSM